MSSLEISEQPRHSIQLVARRTGLTPAVIRAWERRYQAIQPDRSPTRRRLYSDAEVERLLLLRRVTLAGRRIGSVALLPDGKLRDLLREDEEAASKIPNPIAGLERTPGLPFVSAGLDAIRDLDETRLESVLHRASMEVSTIELMESVLQPILRTVGHEWRDANMEIYHEHLATSVIRALLDRLRRFHPQPAEAPEIIVATPAGQTHDVGALMVALSAAARGWRVTFLGPDLPGDQIAEAAARCRARAVAVSVTACERQDDVANEIILLRKQMPPGATLLVGGRAVDSIGSRLRDVGALTPGSLGELRLELDRISGATS